MPSGKVYKILKNGEKKHVGKLSKGIPYGDWSKLNNEGDVLEIINFANGIPGRRYVIIYYDNGQKHIEGSYLKSKKNGLFKMYYENGVEKALEVSTQIILVWVFGPTLMKMGK